MIDRRTFLQLSVAAAAMATTGKLVAKTKSRSLGVQLYTVRDEAERDLATVLGAIKKIGYDEVELYWNVYSRPAKELRRMVTDHGLRAPAGHFNYDGINEKMLDYGQELGLEYYICPMLPKDMWNQQSDYERAADQFNHWGEQAKERGMQFGFHDHNYEFRHFGGTTGFEILMKGADPKLVCLEMDCYWIVQAGRDPIAMFKEYGNRIQLLHLKDRKPGFATSQELNEGAEHFTEVGAGNIRWADVLAAADGNGVEHLFVERDLGDLAPLESIRRSYEYLKKLS